MPDLREKCAYIKIYDIIWLSSFLLFKNVDSEQNSWFFGPKSRSSVGGFPYNFPEIIIEIIKKNWRWPWKSMFWLIFNQNEHFQRFEQCVFSHCFIAFDPNFRSFRGTNLNENRCIGAFNLADH